MYLIALVVLMIIGLGCCSSLGRRLLYFPSHAAVDGGVLRPWVSRGETIGYAREVASPKTVWLMLHGNAGQAADRSYALGSFSDEDSVYILEYPGYGRRAGKPSQASFNQAARAGYLDLRERYPDRPVCVAAESIGSGPASYLGTLTPGPDKIVLMVPFDRLSRVAKAHFPGFLVGLLLKDDWDNIEALSHYQGPVEIYGAEGDTIIPASHARALAGGVPGAKLTMIPGGHNDWADEGKVRIRNR